MRFSLVVVEKLQMSFPVVSTDPTATAVTVVHQCQLSMIHPVLLLYTAHLVTFASHNVSDFVDCMSLIARITRDKVRKDSVFMGLMHTWQLSQT